MRDNSPIAFDKHDRYELHFQLVRATITVKGILETRDIVDISFDESTGMYTVCNLDGSDAWYGVDANKNKAILTYLARRLGIEDEEHA